MKNMEVVLSGPKRRGEGTSENKREENQLSRREAFLDGQGDPAQTGGVGQWDTGGSPQKPGTSTQKQFRDPSFPKAGAGLGNVRQPPPATPLIPLYPRQSPEGSTTGEINYGMQRRDLI